ncbi:hypothetical protein Bca52824_016609 [Brassica carinata]|uniref:Uncharacterized protein n=1 Tax=Brassica carinata TaxID=52824 RepID=A0A8X7W5E7_BRACI|nr:hypothetical protein Bca52824_016609 [Brassica carinata]
MEIPPVNQVNALDRGPIPSRGRLKPNGGASYAEVEEKRAERIEGFDVCKSSKKQDALSSKQYNIHVSGNNILPPLKSFIELSSRILSLVVFRLIKLQIMNQGQAYGAFSDEMHIILAETKRGIVIRVLHSYAEMIFQI